MAEHASAPSGALAIRGGAIRVAGYAGGVVVSLGSATILVRHLGVAQFGRYATVTSLLAIVGGVTEAGITLYGIREYNARASAERRELMASLLGMRLVMTLVGIACAAVFALVAGYAEVLIWGALITGAGLLFQVTADVLSIPLQVHLRLARLTFVDLGRRLLALVLIAVLAIAGAGLLPLFAVSAGAGLAAVVALAGMVRSSFPLRADLRWRSWGVLAADTLPSAVATSIGIVYFYVTIIVMSLIASSTQTGLFATSFRITLVALGVPILLLTAIFPVISRQGSGGVAQDGRLVGKVFAAAAVSGGWLSIAMALGASVVLDVIAGHQGHRAVPVLRIQAVVLTLSFLSASSALTLISLRRYRALIITSATALALNIVLGLVLIPGLGARGGALADAVTEGLVAIALTWIVMRAVPDHAIRASLAPPLLLALALSVGVVLTPIGAVAHVAVATLVYFGVLLLARAIPPELLRAARGVGALRSLR